MKRFLFFSVLSICISIASFANNNAVSEDLLRLDNAIASRPNIEQAKRTRIERLMTHVYTSENPYSDYKKIYEEYKSYNYDTALVFAKKMQSEAIRLGRDQYQVEAATARAFVYLSGGLFKEAYDVLSCLSDKYDSLPDIYYYTFARLLWDMADYAGGEVALQYDSLAVTHIKQILSHVTPADSAQYWYPLAAIDLRQHQYQQSIARMKEALLDSRCTEHERAIYESSLAFANYQLGKSDIALHHYINAAIYDMLSSTYETVALRMVAEILYEQGETAAAERYIRLAMADATHYHARHRQISISQLLPIIEEQQNDELLRQRHLAYVLLIFVFILLIGAGFAMRFIVKRSRAIHAAQRTIHDMNQKLIIANKLKEELLGTFLVSGSRYLSRIEKYQQQVKQNAIDRRYNELMTIPRTTDAHIQRANLDRKMDTMLLGLFPSFVQDFNNLLQEGERYVLKPNELLNTPMRIFALMRLGVTQNEQIAEILDCSINTVYTYKTRTIARSDLTADQFQEALMRIPSFSSSE